MSTAPQNGLFRRLRGVFFFGGIGLLVIAKVTAESASFNSIPHAGLACGLAVAGGLCFIATALVHRGQQREP